MGVITLNKLMDKLYSLSFPKNTAAPSKETLRFIVQFAAAYEPIKIRKTSTGFIAN